ncbi:AEC family transporter [Motilimonas sp. E26]|uniref:AEC family transporter n=1 Tax=Motilimonas sp. E26 TaxID=2865674 RepID=UPI001E49C76B|nr:AEC family transporter [Motilimonas sp. E26]MCE0557569.1 AEC family transporter [Motilimonas sp. E26]
MPVIDVVLPPLVLTLLGFCLVKSRLVTSAESQALSKFVFTYALPALLFVSVAKAVVPSPIPWTFLGAYYGALLLVFVIAVHIVKKYFSYQHVAQSIFAMGCVYSNIAIIGIPLTIYGLGEAALLPLFILISIHNLVLFTLGEVTAQWQQLSLHRLGQSLFIILKQLLLGPITASLLAGAMFNLLDIVVYPPLFKTISLVGEAAIPLALVVLGMSLTQYRIYGHLSAALLLVAFKMGIFPLLVACLVLFCFELEPLWSTTAILAAALPVGVSSYAFAQRYLNHPQAERIKGVLAAAILMSTMLSTVTLSVLLVWLAQ